MAVGVVLSQEGQQGDQVIAFFSCSLSQLKRKYCVTRRELLAASATSAYISMGRGFSCTLLLNFKEPEGQLARWLETLQGYSFEVHHRTGHLHTNADALLRRTCGEDECMYCQCVDKQNTVAPVVAALHSSRR